MTREELIAVLDRAVRLGRMDRTMAAYALKAYFPNYPLRAAEGTMARSDPADRDGPGR